MDNNHDNRVAVIRSINSTDMRDQTQKEIARVPPVPPPKPKINPSNCVVDVTKRSGKDSNVINVRQAILKGSRNPAGLPCDEPFTYIPPNQDKLSPIGMEFPKLQINSLSTRSSVISNEERDANLDIIFSDWGSQTFVDKISNFQSKNETCQKNELPKITKASSHEPIFTPKSLEIKYDQNSLRLDKKDVKSSNLKVESLSSPTQAKKTDVIKDREYLFPRLEKQSNQIVVLSENNPTELNNDIIRNCDVVEESVPGIGHTGNLLKYWKNVEAPEKDDKIENNRHSFVHDDVTVCVNQPPKQKQLEKKFAPTDHEQVLNDILQEFESFNKDILDLNVEPETSKEMNPSEDNVGEVETAYVLSKYDFLSTTSTTGKNKDSTTPSNSPNQEEGVYYELDTDKISNDFTKPDRSTQEFTIQTEPEKQVTLIGFRKLNNDEQDSNSIRSSQSITRVEGTQPNNDDLKEDTSRYSQEDEKTNKKKAAPKHKCTVM